MLKEYLFIVIPWIIALFIVAFLGSVLMPSHSNVGEAAYWDRWSNWDGNAYLEIAKTGIRVDHPYTMVFFPLYPILIKTFSLFINSELVSGLIISWVSLLLSGWIFLKLIIKDLGLKTAKNSLIAILLFPTSFFFLASYSESLFLLLVITAFYTLETKHNWLPYLSGFLLSATRMVGIALIPAILYQIWISKETLNRKLINLLKLFIPFSGLISYFGYLYYLTGKPFIFLEVQSQHFHRNLGLTYPFKVLFSYVKSLILYPGNRFIGRDSTIIALEFIVSILFFLLIVHVYRKINRAYAIYAFIAWSIPLMSGMTGSMLRYVLILFPCFISLGILMTQSRLFKYTYMFIAGSLLILFTINFFNGFWIG